jgi:signal recognition particle receptor subunit beta
VAQLDFAERQLTLKLVYYGPPHSGKTSNLRALHSAVDKLNRGRLMTLDTRDDRTLFFDLLPLFFRASGFSFQLKVYTVPGQPVHEATRKIVLANADAVAFIADSQPGHREANRLSWQNLMTNLKAKNLEDVPVVVQYNKRDLPEAVPAPVVVWSRRSSIWWGAPGTTWTSIGGFRTGSGSIRRRSRARSPSM